MLVTNYTQATMAYMVRESKSAATIRRKRPQQGPSNFTLKHKSSDDHFDPSAEEPEFYESVPVEGPPIMRLMLSNDWILFLGLLAFRSLNALMIQTFYVPDEYWQSLEVAHNLAFGEGYLTWEWHVGLRGYTYPAIFAAIYKVLGILHLDNRILLIKLPRLTQAFFAAVGDIYLYKLSRRLSGTKAARLSLLCQLTSWFMFYCSTRTLTNSMETVLTTMAMYYFPWPGTTRLAQTKYITLVGLAVIVRPTAAIVWIPMCTWHIWLYRHIAWRVIKYFAEIGLAILCVSSLVDRFFYGRWVHVHYNFLEFNVLANMGAFYGSHPWHWYITQGFVVIIGSHIFPFLMAARKGVQSVILGIILWTVCVYSLLEHKEFRFLMPILPLCMHVCGSYLDLCCDDAIVEDTDTEKNRKSLYKRVTNLFSGLTRKRFLVISLIVTNLPIAMYTCLIHQRGTVDVTRFLHDEAVTMRRDEPMKVMFLMPCHSTPFHSYIHQNISLQFLTCEPNLEKVSHYVDEADMFYQHPVAWLRRVYESRPRKEMPTHLVMYNVLQGSIAPWLKDMGYTNCAKIFHTHFPEGRIGSHIFVTCKIEWITPSKAKHSEITLNQKIVKQ